MPEILYIVGFILLGIALRSFRSVVAMKAGMLAFLVASFLFGFFLTGESLLGGTLAVAMWFLLPWVEILTRVRRMRLPTTKRMRGKFPPSRTEFPQIHEVTKEIEDAGFNLTDDVGWEDDDTRQFFRIFHRESDQCVAKVCLNEQAGNAFFYVAVSTLTHEGTIWRTWNYPFSYTMKLPPNIRVQRSFSAQSFTELLEIHRAYLDSNWVGDSSIAPQNPEDLPRALEEEISQTVEHNMSRGIIEPAGEGLFRYSPRGMFFLWTQLVKDIVKLG